MADARATAGGDDRPVVARLAAGDATAMSELYDRHARAVYSLASRILSDRHEAEDVVQDVFAQAWRQATRYDPERGTVATWLLVMARARAIDRLRSRRGQAVRSEREGVVTAPAPGPGPEADAITAEQVDRLRAALRELTDAQRTAIELAYYEGLSQTEVAARLQEPLGTIKTRIRSGLLKLRAALLQEQGSQ
jgi:RNA polymerase sigma-70 factor (ECF subfamily)